MYKLQILLSSVLALSVSTVALTGKWTEIPGPANAALESITVSTNYLWAIDNRNGVGLTRADNNVVYCRRPCSDAGSWMDPGGQLDQTIDASETEVWGVNDRGQIYKRPIDGSDGWVQISGGRNANCRGKCFSDASVSNNGYIWAISNENETYMLCSQNGITRRCANSDRLLIDDELSLVHIEAGDEEVWAVNANNRIFKRPVNGSGEWSSVPGEMRYISASGTEHIWGIAPNDSLYVCEKPCTGDWRYVGGSFKFKQIDGDNNSSVIGVTTNNTLIAMSLQGTGVSETEKATDTTTIIILPTSTLLASTTFASIKFNLSKTPLVSGAPSTTVTVTVHRSSETPDSVKGNTSPGTLPITVTVYQSSEIPESAKTSTSPSVLIGVVAGMVAFSIALLLLVPLSIIVIAVLYARKLKKVRDRRRAVVITQYGLGSTEMLEVIHDERDGCGNMMLNDPVYATIEDTFTKPLSQDKQLVPSSSHPERKPVTATRYRSCTDFSYLDDDIDKNIAYASIVTSSEFEVNPAYITFSEPEFDCPTNVHNIIQRRHSCPH